VAPAGQVIELGGAGPEGVVVDPVSGLAAVAVRSPDRLVLVDPTTLTVVGRPRVPGSARHLQLGGTPGTVLVPGEDTDLVSTVSLPAGQVLSSVKVGRQPHDAAAAGDGLVVDSDELGSGITESRGSTVVAHAGGLLQPGGLAASGGRIGVVDVRARLLDVYTPSPLALVGRIPVGAGPTHAVPLGPGIVAVADTTGGAVYVIRIAGTPTVLQTFPLPGRPYGMAVDLARHRLWVTTTSDDVLHELTISGSATSPKLTAGRTFPTVQQPNSAAVVPSTGRVLVAASIRDGLLDAIDP
jgi:DNA-binding beta-propeller fold protein YncE